MGVIVDFSEFLGKGFGDITTPQGKFAKGLQGAVCEVYNELPGNWQSANNVVAGFQRGFMRSLCGDFPPPVPTPLPECVSEVMLWGTFRRAFKDSGGVCGDRGYWRCEIGGGEELVGNTKPTEDNGLMYIQRTDGVLRPVSAASKAIYDQEFFGSPNIALPFVSFDSDCVLGTASGGGDEFAFAKRTFRNPIPDYCVDGGEHEFIPNPGVQTKNFTVNFNDNTTENFTVNIAPDGDGYFNYPLNVDVGGVSVDLRLGDINIGGDDGGGSSTDTFLPNPNPSDYTVFFPPGTEEDEELEEVEVQDQEIDWVLVDIVRPPKKGKTILHVNAENNTYFAGYFAWVIEADGQYWLEEQPIRKSKTAFRAPENLTGYRLYAVNGATLSVRQFKQVIEGE